MKNLYTVLQKSDFMTASLTGFAILMVLIMLRMPIAFAMALIGFIGFALQTSWSASLSMVADIKCNSVRSSG